MKTLVRAGQDRAARCRGELADDRGAGRVSSASDAERCLTAPPARDAPPNADPFGPSDPRYTYLTRTYD
jgi:hypothetical protein